MSRCFLLVSSPHIRKLSWADFSGRAIAGFAVGMLTMVVPLYISEVREHSSY